MTSDSTPAPHRIGYSPFRTAPYAVSLGLFLVWLDISFRISAGEFGSAPSALPQHSDLPWLTVLAAATAFSFVLWATADGLRLRPLSQLILGSLAMTAGSAGYAAMTSLGSSASSSLAILPFAAIAGVGIPLAIGAWLSLFSSSRNKDCDETIVVVLLEATVVSLAAMSCILLLDAVGCLIVVSALPAMGGLCFLIPAKPSGRETREKDLAWRPRSKAQRQKGAFDPRPLVILLSCFIVFFLLGTIGAPATETMRSRAFWLYDFAAIGEAALLVVTLVLFRPTHFHGVLTMLLATAVALTPFLFIAKLDAFCVVLLKLTTLCTYALVLLYLTDCNRSRPQTRGTYLIVAAVGALILLGLVAGEIVRSLQGFSDTTFVLVGVALLYAVLMTAALVFSQNRRVRVEHILTGKFDTEEDIAQAQGQVLSQLYPSLSERELEVVTLLLQHYTANRIAQKLVVSENTVKTHIRHIYRKLGINSKQQLLVLAQETAPREEEAEEWEHPDPFADQH